MIQHARKVVALTISSTSEPKRSSAALPVKRWHLVKVSRSSSRPSSMNLSSNGELAPVRRLGPLRRRTHGSIARPLDMTLTLTGHRSVHTRMRAREKSLKNFDRCQAAARGDQGAQSPGQHARRAAAAILSAYRQARRHDGGALCPRQTVQAPSSPTAHRAQPAWSYHPRHPPQDRRPNIAKLPELVPHVLTPALAHLHGAPLVVSILDR